MPGLRAPDVPVAAPSRAGPTLPGGPSSGLSSGPNSGTAIGVAAGSAAMACVGGSVAVSSVLAGAPVYTAEAVRYGGACLLLVALARLTGRRLRRPNGAEWLWLSGIAVTGLVVFNLALVEGSRHAEPAVLGVAVACVPAVLALDRPGGRGRQRGPARRPGTQAASLGRHRGRGGRPGPRLPEREDSRPPPAPS